MKKLLFVVSIFLLSFQGFTQLIYEDFSTMTFSVAPTGWLEMKGYLGTNSIPTGTTSGWIGEDFLNGSSNMAAKINVYDGFGSTTRQDWLISPSINLGTGGNYELRFKAGLTEYGLTTQGRLGRKDTVAVVISTNNGASWSSANVLRLWDTTVAPPLATGQSYTISLASYTGNVKIGFYASAKSTTPVDVDFFIDDFMILDINSPYCQFPFGLDTSNVTSTSALLNWQAGASETSWKVIWGKEDSALVSGNSSIVSGTPSKSITGLLPNTNYEFYVKAICGAGDTSILIGPFNFKTVWAPCTNVFVTPVTNNFATFPGSCWYEAKGRLGNSTTLTSFNSGYWDMDGFANSGTTGAAKVNIYGTSRLEWLVSPIIDLGTSTKYLHFDIALTDYNNSNPAESGSMGIDDTLAVVISTNNGTTWSKANIVKMWKTGEPISHTGQRVTVNLGAYSNQVRIGFYAASSISNEDNDLFIDNIEVSSTPGTTPPPSSISEFSTAQMNIYPNPSNEGKVNISGINKGDIISIYDMNGREVMSLKSSNNGLQELNIATLSKGTYTVIIKSNLVFETHKLIVN